MRKLCVPCVLGAVLLAAGCADSKWAMFRTSQNHTRLPGGAPTADQLVGYLNQNAQRIQSVQCPYLDITCEYGIQQFGIRGQMICEKPRNFHLVAGVGGKTEADIGSNKDEFWYFIARNDPPALVHCSYDALSQGTRIPFPFQPEWVMEALGMAEIPPGNYQVVARGGNYELIRESVSQGQRVQKVTVFSQQPAQVQVRGHYLSDARGKVICSAQILDAQSLNGGNGPVVPRQIVLDYRAEKIKLKMKLYNSPQDIVLNQPFEQAMFQRPNLTGVPSYDLASGPDNPGQIRRAGGVQR